MTTIKVMCSNCPEMFPFPAKADSRSREGYKLDFKNKDWWTYEDAFRRHVRSHSATDLTDVLVELVMDRVKHRKWAYDIA
jgi:hypothetical protein